MQWLNGLIAAALLIDVSGKQSPHYHKMSELSERDWLFIAHQWEALDSVEGHMITVMKNNA